MYIFSDNGASMLVFKTLFFQESLSHGKPLGKDSAGRAKLML